MPTLLSLEQSLVAVQERDLALDAVDGPRPGSPPGPPQRSCHRRAAVHRTSSSRGRDTLSPSAGAPSAPPDRTQRIRPGAAYPPMAGARARRRVTLSTQRQARVDDTIDVGVDRIGPPAVGLVRARSRDWPRCRGSARTESERASRGRGRQLREPPSSRPVSPTPPVVSNPLPTSASAEGRDARESNCIRLFRRWTPQSGETAATTRSNTVARMYQALGRS